MISLVVPVYNEEITVPIFYQTVRTFPGLQDQKVEIIFVNDGSSDTTAAVIRAIAKTDPLVHLVDLTRNFGKEAALMAGLARAGGAAVIPMDVDLQDPVEAIPQMVAKWQAGADVVLAKRVDRSADGRFKRETAALFYRLHNKISTVKIEENVGDFRLISRQTLGHILQLPERNLFMKGLLSWVGGRTEIVEYRRASRVAGSTKFNGWKLLNLALEGITSFSTVPLRILSYIGFGISLLAFLFGLWMVLDKMIFGNPVPGYPSLIVAVMFLGGIQIIGIGIVGEYVGRIYIETKQRPRYLVQQAEAQGDAEADTKLVIREVDR